MITGTSKEVFAMETQKLHFNSNLLIVVAVLYVLTIEIFVYPMLASEPEFTEWVDDPCKSPHHFDPAFAPVRVDLCAVRFGLIA